VTVLILATEHDISADRMVRTLANRGVPVFRADLSWFPQRLSLDAELRDSRWTGRLATPYREVTLEGLRSIWYRNPSSFQFPMAMSHTERQHAQHEAKLGLGGVLAHCRCAGSTTPAGTLTPATNRASWSRPPKPV
jgi:hypothetical protein